MRKPRNRTLPLGKRNRLMKRMIRRVLNHKYENTNTPSVPTLYDFLTEKAQQNS